MRRLRGFMGVLWGARRVDAAAQELRARESTRPTAQITIIKGKPDARGYKGKPK